MDKTALILKYFLCEIRPYLTHSEQFPLNGSPQVGVIYAFAENVVSFGFLFTILSRCIRPNTSVPVPKRSRL
ncbi:hypothetical protein, partial [Serratia marcescens]|uniref:hypothetical protein n=1 Tax=Serratia marcescens TaxID=615 RepID=UPI0034E2DB31